MTRGNDLKLGLADEQSAAPGEESAALVESSLLCAGILCQVHLLRALLQPASPGLLVSLPSPHLVLAALPAFDCDPATQQCVPPTIHGDAGSRIFGWMAN